MTALLLVPATALMLGALHAFDIDHVAAVTSYIARRPGPRAAVSFALRWALGHSATVMGVGLASTLFAFSITAGIRTAAELAVGAMLVGRGFWVLVGLRHGHLLIEEHEHGDHSHAHVHRPGHEGWGRRSVFWVGVLHGLAGSAGLLVIIPVTLMASSWAVLAYILMFSVGVTTAMMACALPIGGVFGKVARGAAARWYPWLAGAAGSCTLLLGLGWISLTLAAWRS